MAESSAFPWLKHLGEDGQREFFEEILQISVLSKELGTPISDYADRLHVCVAAWKSTAEVHADPELLAALTSNQGFNEEDFVEAKRPSKPKMSRRRCGASYPHERGEDGWEYCVLESGHTGSPHEDADGQKWRDGYTVTVVIEDEVRSVPDHVHDFVGDEDTCTRGKNNGCQLTWGERTAQDREWGMDHD
jgi:hypothetical protein